MIGATAISLAAPLLVKIAIDRGIEPARRRTRSTSSRSSTSRSCSCGPLLERVIVLCSARAGERFLGDLRVAAYEKLQELSMPFFEETRAGVLVSRLTHDVQTLTTFTRLVLVEVVGSVLLFVVLDRDPDRALAAAVARDARVACRSSSWSSLRYGKRSRPAFLALRDRVADTMSSLQEGLTGVRVVQSFGREERPLRLLPRAARARRYRRGGASRSSTSASSR